MAAPSMVTRDGDNLVVRSVVSGDPLFGTEQKHHASDLLPTPEEPPPEEFLPQTRVKRNYTCTTCEFKTRNPRSFLYHLRDDHKQKFKIFECPRCLYASRHSQKLHRHMRMVHVLGKTSAKATAKQSHRLRRLVPKSESRPESNPTVYKCSLCDFKTKNSKALGRHELVAHLKKKFLMCSKCDYTTHVRARFTKHVKYHSMPMIKCDICDFRTPYKWNLERHNKNHQGDGPFKCSTCNFTADIKQSLTVHELNHHNPQLFIRRMYKVGASDMLTHDDQLEIVKLESREANHLSKTERVANRKRHLKEMKMKKSNKQEGKRALVGTMMENPSESQIRIKCRTCLFSHESLEEVRNHELAVHNLSEKKKRPIPNLIPIGPPPQKKTTPPLSDRDMNEICVKPSQTSSLKDFASLIGDDNAFTGEEIKLQHRQTSRLRLTPDNRSSSPDSVDSKKDGVSKKKSSSFFDKLQEKLMTATTEADLLCSNCGYQAKCLSELVKHKESFHPDEEATESATCLNCGLVCSSITELREHSMTCDQPLSPTLNSKCKSLTDKVSVTLQSDPRNKGHEDEEHSEEKHPMENKVFVWNTFQLTPEAEPPDEPSVLHEKLEDSNIYLGTEIKPGYGNASVMPSAEAEAVPRNSVQLRKVYKCPHCDFWASTASRFHVHIVGHLNKRPFRCSMCQYSSNWRWDITKHIRLKAFRDSGHQGARVLLTDETGMRDYAKYNKYLALVLIKVEANCGNEKLRRILPKSLHSPTNSSTRSTPTKRSLSPSSSEKSPSKKSRPIYNTKKMWKCKKCQFRNSDRQVVLAHVRSHYYPDAAKTGDAPPVKDEKPDNESNLSLSKKNVKLLAWNMKNSDSENDEVNGSGGEFMCETCPFETDSMKALEDHSEKHFVIHGANHRCKVCPYYTSSEADLNQHCLLHESSSTEDPLVQKNVIYACLKCPYLGRKKSQLAYHKKWHSVNPEEAKHICNKCSYCAPNNTILALHVRLHRYNYMDNSVPKKPLVPPHPSPSTPVMSYADISGVDTTKFSEIPLAWVCKGSRISKMFKCRFCPHVNIRKPNIQEHEKMHSDRSPGKGSFSAQHRCTLCNYVCNNAGVLSSHAKVHQAFYGTVCSIADPGRPDDEQIEEVKQKMIQDELSDLKGDAVVGKTSSEIKPGVEKLIHFCSTCPARFLYPKELMIHSRFHVLKLPFRCETCSYTARQRQHLFIHRKVHTNDYHERTKILLMSYSESQENPRPRLTDRADDSGSVWIISKEKPVDPESSITCPKCPAKFSDKDSYDRHFAFHGWPGKFKCKFCDFTVLQFESLIQHELLHIEDDESSESKVKNKSEEAKVRGSSDREFGSQIQGSAEFVYPTCVRNGKKKEKRYKCHKCPTAFEKREQYKIHISLHGAKQKYKCEICDYSVKYYANFVQHLKRHLQNEESGRDGNSLSEENVTDEFISEDNSNDKSLSETISDKSKKSMNMCVADEQTLEFLKQREATNRFTTEPLHRCPICPYTNSRRDAVMSHYKCHSTVRGKSFSCKYCDYRVPQSRFFKEHVKTHFTPMKYIRPECYMKINQLEIWAEPVDQNDNMSKFLVFRDKGEEIDFANRFLPKFEPTVAPNSPKGRVYINLKTGEEEVELDDDMKQESQENEDKDHNDDVPSEPGAEEEFNNETGENSNESKKVDDKTSPKRKIEKTIFDPSDEEVSNGVANSPNNLTDEVTVNVKSEENVELGSNEEPAFDELSSQETKSKENIDSETKLTSCNNQTNVLTNNVGHGEDSHQSATPTGVSLSTYTDDTSSSSSSSTTSSSSSSTSSSSCTNPSQD